MSEENFEIAVFSGLGDGLFDAGTRAIDKMIDDIKPTLSEADHLRYWQWLSWTNGVISRAARYGRPTIILIGMSMGAKSVIDSAARLRDYGFEVELAVGIDPTAGYRMQVPKNVVRTVEFWSKPTSWFGELFNAPYRARQNAPNGSRGGKYVYLKDWPGMARPPINIRGSHLHVPLDKVTQAVIKEEVSSIING